MELKTNKVLGFFPLLAIVVGSIIGAGIYNSPADLASKANPGWIFIAWLITATGVFSLAKVFQYLANRRPELEGGIYSYAREVAGEFAGFNSAYGYWWSIIFANLAYLFAIPKVLSNYFPLFAHDKWAAFLFTSMLLWGYHILIWAGIKTAGITNSIITVLKVMPLLFVVFVTLFRFKRSLLGDPFSTSLSGTGELTNSWHQISSSLGITVFAFLGIEAAVVISNKARKSRDVGRVTLLGFIITLIIYIFVSSLTMGVAPAHEIINASSPLGAILGYAIGSFGMHFLNFGFLFSVAGAFISWLLLAAETPYICAVQDGAFPQKFARSNDRATPIFSLTITNIITQAVLILFYSFSTSPDITARGNAPLLQNLYSAALSLSVICSLIPYLFSSILSARHAFQEKIHTIIIYSVLSFVFFFWVIIAMGKYTAPAIIIYATGAIFRIIVYRERRKAFPAKEFLFYTVLLIASIIIAYCIGRGWIIF